MGRIFGEFLKQLRADRKMTLRDVEQKAQISNAYLSQVESGERSIPTMKILDKLARVYGVPISLLTEKVEEEFRHEKKQTKNQAEKKMPAPDTEFICRGYESLSEEKKLTFKDFLQYLQKDNKDKK